jgi:hypothetical protein
LQAGTGNKADIQAGLTDANNQLAGLEQQQVNSGCIASLGGVTPVRTTGQ